MSSSNCVRRLARPSAVFPSPSTSPSPFPRRMIAPATASCVIPVTTAPFSSSASAQAKAAKPMAGATMIGRHMRAGKKMRLKKSKRNSDGDRSKPPQPGERKAFRKRIVLSNDNALPVPGIRELEAGSMRDPASVGTVMALPTALQDQLRAVDAFKPTQTWGMFRNASTLVRAETVGLSRQMHAAAAEKKALRLVITGDRISGKSMLLLQAIADAYLNDWVVFHIPEAHELVTASTEYAPITGTNPVQYMQQNYALRTIQALRKANADLFSRLKTAIPHPELSQHIPVGSTLLQLANAAKEADGSWTVFQALWRELTAPGAGRPPILFALDGLAHVMKLSDYRSPAFELIHAHDLALVRLFVDCLSGAEPLPNGGAVIAATSRGNAPRIASMDLALAQRVAEQQIQEQQKQLLPPPSGNASVSKTSLLPAQAQAQAQTEVQTQNQAQAQAQVQIPQRDPYFNGYDERVLAALGSVQVLPLGSVSKREARALMEYWAASGMLMAEVDENVVSEKWTLGGNGNLGEMERATLLTMRL